MEVSTKLSAARLWACRKVPYFTTSLLSLTYREVPLGTLPSSGNGTMAMTDRGVLMYEAEAVKRWSVEECGSVVVHELMHFLRKHGQRRLARNPLIWNLANDCEINDDLHEMKLPLPDGGGIKPADFKLPNGRLAEEYYVEIMKQADPEDGKDGDKPPPKGFGGKCGSCAGNGEPDEQQSSGGPGEGRSDIEQQVMRVQTANAVHEHVKQNGIGSVPAGLRIWADEMVQPTKVPWGEKLAHTLRGAVDFSRGLIESTYQKISRRQAGLGFGIGRPIMSSPVGRHPRVYVAIDTSGSMGPDEIKRGVSEIVAIVEACGGTITLLSCDCAVHTTQEVKSLDQILEALKGGGGTDFYPVFEAIEEMTPPDVLVLITDGGGYAPSVGPEAYTTIWLLVGGHRCKPLVREGGHIQWGDIIEVDED